MWVVCDLDGVGVVYDEWVWLDVTPPPPGCGPCTQ